MIDRLCEEPHRFEFFQAVRLLERWFVREEGLAPANVLSQRVQFRNSLSLAFPASEIAEFKVIATAGGEAEDGAGRTRGIRHVEMTPAFIGLLGAGGTLPAFYTELFAQRELYRKDPAARAFVDVFLHRAVVQFYRAWRKHRLAIEFEADRRHRFLPMVLALAGIGHPAMRDRLRPREGGVADDTLAFYAGALQQRPRSAAMIRRVLEQYFGVPVQLEPFIGRWFALPHDNQTAVGRSNAGLGRGAVVGARVWQRDLRMRLRVGPMTSEKSSRFRPGKPAELALRELLMLFTGVTLEYEVRLGLRADAVRPAKLDGVDGASLGWDSFLLSRPAAADRFDPGYVLFEAA